MPVAIRAITRLQDADDINVSPGVGVDEYALVYDHDTARFVLRAPAAPFAGILATGATVGATAQAQAFTLGVVSPFLAPAADSTTAWQVRKADKTTGILNVDTTNARVGIWTAAPGAKLDVNGNAWIGTGALAQTLVLNAGGPALTTADIFVIKADTYPYMQFVNTGSGGATGDGFKLGIETNRGAIWMKEDWPIDFYTKNLSRMTIDNSGLVGIGTTSPATRLDIDAGAMTMAEMTAPTGVANKATVYARDNGSGKTQLCVKLGDDVEIVLATQA